MLVGSVVSEELLETVGDTDTDGVGVGVCDGVTVSLRSSVNVGVAVMDTDVVLLDDSSTGKELVVDIVRVRDAVREKEGDEVGSLLSDGDRDEVMSDEGLAVNDPLGDAE